MEKPVFPLRSFSATLPPGLETWIPNQGLSQCVAVSRSDKLVIRAKDDFSSCAFCAFSRPFPSDRLGIRRGKFGLTDAFAQTTRKMFAIDLQ
jgi:hypothetical protein